MTDRFPLVAIPSYQRPKILKERTLRLLTEMQVPPSAINIFVADEDEAEAYARVLPSHAYNDLIIAEPGMGAVRRYIKQFYADGQELLCIDDDISGFYRNLDDKTYHPLDAAAFQVMVRLGFWSCREVHARLWGIYPVLNALFMKKRVNVGLTYIVGAFWGCINSHDPRLTVTLDDKEDFERTIKHYIADGAVVRLEAYSLKTSYYTTPGGMQVRRTPERVDASARYLAARYPTYCKLNLTKKSGRTEIRLTRQKQAVLA